MVRKNGTPRTEKQVSGELGAGMKWRKELGIFLLSVAGGGALIAALRPEIAHACDCLWDEEYTLSVQSVEGSAAAKEDWQEPVEGSITLSSFILSIRNRDQSVNTELGYE